MKKHQPYCLSRVHNDGEKACNCILSCRKQRSYSLGFQWCGKCLRDPCKCSREVLLEHIAVLEAQLNDFHVVSDNIRGRRMETK